MGITPAELGQNIKWLRKDNELTQEELAKLIGFRRDAIANWEKGRCYASPGAFLEMTNVLGTTLNELFGRKTSIELDEITMKFGKMIMDLKYHDRKKLHDMIEIYVKDCFSQYASR